MGQPDAVSCANRNHYPDTDAHPYRHADRKPDRNTHTDTNADTDADCRLLHERRKTICNRMRLQTADDG
jgi:hypothetical protein